MKKNIVYREKELFVEYMPTKERDVKESEHITVQAPQYTESTYDVGFKVLEELGTNCYAVYMALLSYRNVKTNDCHPSANTIHKDFNISLSTIKRSIKTLYENGYIDINSGYKNISNNYYFCKEYWYNVWNKDFYQTHAQKRENPILENRKNEEEEKAEIQHIYIKNKEEENPF